MKPFTIFINYRSGRQVELRVTKFEVKYVGDELRSASWVTADGAYIKPLWLGLRDIESIYEKRR